MNYSRDMPSMYTSKDDPMYEQAKVRWSRPGPLPEVGDRVVVKMNNLGPAIVLGYTWSDGEDGVHYVGLWLTLLDPPDWFIKQNNGNVPCNIFGAELADA